MLGISVAAVTGTILLVEDNVRILDANKYALTKAGHRVITAETLADARRLLEKEKPDIAVLDIMLPDGDGLEYLPELRGIYKIPVLFLTSKVEQWEIIEGLRAGGNDYITKPYKINEFLARVESALQWELSRREEMPADVIRGSLKLDILANQAFMNDSCLQLTNTEFKLLYLCVQNEDRLLDTDLIYETIWKRPLVKNKNAIRSTVKRLRQKIAPAGYNITTKRGKGYVFEKEQ